MSEPEPFIYHSDGSVSENGARDDDITEVLEVLRRLAQKSNHPIVRSCLEQASEDIVHLTSYGDDSQDQDNEPEAADFS